MFVALTAKPLIKALSVNCSFLSFCLDYEESLFPLRDCRGKRTSEQAQKSPGSLNRLKRDAHVEPLHQRPAHAMRAYVFSSLFPRERPALWWVRVRFGEMYRVGRPVEIEVLLTRALNCFRDKEIVRFYFCCRKTIVKRW